MEIVVNNPLDDDRNILEFRITPNKKCKSHCEHQRFVIDNTHGSVECADCGEVVSAFHALKVVAGRDSNFSRRLTAKREELAKIQAYKPWLRAVKELERIWRRKMLPLCPHCGHGVTAEGLERSGSISQDYAASLTAPGRDGERVG